jgi:hypothetical protein
VGNVVYLSGDSFVENFDQQSRLPDREKVAHTKKNLRLE